MHCYTAFMISRGGRSNISDNIQTKKQETPAQAAFSSKKHISIFRHVCR
jgi:hypothetical protein